MRIDEVMKIRAFAVFEITKELLLDGDEDEEISEVYRFSFLILRGAGKFLEVFGESDNLYLDYDKISDGYFKLRFDLVGPKGLTEKEEQIIYIHNQETSELLGQSSNWIL